MWGDFNGLSWPSVTEMITRLSPGRPEVQRAIGALDPKVGPGVDVIEGDQETTFDAERIWRAGARAVEDPAFGTQFGDGPFQKRRPARTRRAHQVERSDAPVGQPDPVVLGQVIVLGEDRLLDRDRLGASVPRLVFRR
jgi:hypothetical protein